MEMAKIVAKIKDFLLDTIFPIECIGCGKEKTWLCGTCLKTMEETLVREVVLSSGIKVIAISDFNNTLLQSVIHNFKYGGIKDLAKPLGLILKKGVQKFTERFKNFIVIPVPLHRRKFLERGFNQNELLLQEVFDKNQVSFDQLVRVRYTKPQVNLKKDKRLTNIVNAFKVRGSKEIRGKNILLFDDVLTTGATLIECARVLKEAGAKKIIGVVLAHDLSFDQM